MKPDPQTEAEMTATARYNAMTWAITTSDRSEHPADIVARARLYEDYLRGTPGTLTKGSGQ